MVACCTARFLSQQVLSLKLIGTFSSASKLGHASLYQKFWVVIVSRNHIEFDVPLVNYHQGFQVQAVFDHAVDEPGFSESFSFFLLDGLLRFDPFASFGPALLPQNFCGPSCFWLEVSCKEKYLRSCPSDRYLLSCFWSDIDRVEIFGFPRLTTEYVILLNFILEPELFTLLRFRAFVGRDDSWAALRAHSQAFNDMMRVDFYAVVRSVVWSSRFSIFFPRRSPHPPECAKILPSKQVNIL